jgi:hypothetical protein
MVRWWWVMNWKGIRKGDHRLSEALYRHLSGGTEEEHKNPRSGSPVIRQGFEARTTEI